MSRPLRIGCPGFINEVIGGGLKDGFSEGVGIDLLSLSNVAITGEWQLLGPLILSMNPAVRVDASELAQ